MGCFIDTIIEQDRKAMHLLAAFRSSSNEMLVKFANLYSKKNYDILKKVYEENDIVFEKLNKKMQEYVKKREESKPLQIATGKCGLPC